MFSKSIALICVLAISTIPAHAQNLAEESKLSDAKQVWGRPAVSVLKYKEKPQTSKEKQYAIHYMLATINWKQNPDECMKHLESIADIENDITTRKFIVLMLDKERAIRQMKIVINQESSEDQAYYSDLHRLSMLLKMQGRDQEAQIYLDKAKQLQTPVIIKKDVSSIS